MKRLLAVAALLLVVGPVSADDVRTAARAVLARRADAVITVRLVVKRRMVFQGRDQGSADAQIEVGGTVISPSGLTVVSEAASSPSGGAGVDMPGADVTDVKLLLPGGREVPARILLRDKDLDLAFVMPEEKGLDLPFVEMAKGAVPEPLDDLVVVYRLGKALARETGVAVAPVRAVVKRPRTFVVTDLVIGLQALGAPAFDLSGRAVGIVVMRRAPALPGAPGGLREALDTLNAIVLTAGDVADVAAQAVKQAEKPPASEAR